MRVPISVGKVAMSRWARYRRRLRKATYRLAPRGAAIVRLLIREESLGTAH
jgi:hypothetical protein